MERYLLILKKGIDLLKSLSKGAKSALICSYIINPIILKDVLGKQFRYDNLILFSGEKSIELDRAVKARKFFDSSSIPLMGHSFHSKLYLFERGNEPKRQLNVVIASFNMTSAGLSQNLEFWSEASAKLNLEKFGVNNVVELILDSRINIDAITWDELCFEEKRQLVVTPALEVLWRLARNGVGLAPGKNRCISDIVLSDNKFQNYDAILVHTLGNNSLSKALEIMIREAAEVSNQVTIRIVSPYHNMDGLKYLHKKCLRIIQNSDTKVKIELLTVFPPDFADKFADPKKQPFASLEDIAKLSSEDKRITFCLKLWKKETKIHIGDIDEATYKDAQNIFLHGKAILVKSGQRCQFLLGSPNITDAAIGKGPDLNFETAVWERRNDVALQLWNDLNLLFEICSSANEEDYRILKTWSSLFGSSQDKPQIYVIGPRDAIGQYLDFFIEKNGEKQALSVHGETPVYFDEIEKSKLLVALKTGAPKISEDAHVYFIPSEFEKTKDVKVQFTTGKLTSNILVDTQKPDIISIRVDVESNLIEEYKVKIKEKGNRIEVISGHLPLLGQKDEEASLLIKTEQGPIEVKCSVNRGTIWVQRKQSKIVSKDASLRIYSKSTVNCYSFGYFRIRYRKREPEFEAKLAYVSPFPFSIYFKELKNPIAARILPNSVDVFLLTKEYDEIPAEIIATKLNSINPFCQSFILCLPFPCEFAEIRIQISFEDEHEGYYSFISPPLRIGYAEIADRETAIYVPDDMAKEAIFISLGNRQKLISTSSKDGYSKFLIPSSLIFCDRDDTSLIIQEDFLTKFHSKLKSQKLICSPDRNYIVSSAPLTLVLSSLDIAKDLQKMCKNITLSWEVRRFGLGKGPNKRHPFILPAKFELLPEEIESVRKTFDMSTGSFEGYLDIELLFEMEGGYVLKSRKETFRILSSKSFVESIKDKIWLLLKEKEKLVSNLLRLFYQALDLNIPFDIFKNAVKCDPEALFRLTYSYDYSYLIQGGFPIFYIKFEKYNQLIEETANMMLENLFVTLSTEHNLPKIPKDVLIELIGEKVKQLVETSIADRSPRGELMITPAKLLQRIDTMWKSYL